MLVADITEGIVGQMIKHNGFCLLKSTDSRVSRILC